MEYSEDEIGLWDHIDELDGFDTLIVQVFSDFGPFNRVKRFLAARLNNLRPACCTTMYRIKGDIGHILYQMELHLRRYHDELKSGMTLDS